MAPWSRRTESLRRWAGSRTCVANIVRRKSWVADGAIPFYKLYDRQGKLRYQFGAQVEEGVEMVDQIDARVEQLLAENG